MANNVLPVSCAPATEDPQQIIIKEMEEMFLGLGFIQTVAMKLVDDQWIDSPWTLASLFDEDIATICNAIRRPGGLVSSKIPDRWGANFTSGNKEPEAHSIYVQINGMLL